jgi:toxin ParE1/3/4
VNLFRIHPDAARRLDEIYQYTRGRWGEAQAERYIRGLFDCFDAIANRRLPWRSVPAQLGVHGYFCRYEKHFIY